MSGEESEHMVKQWKTKTNPLNGNHNFPRQMNDGSYEEIDSNLIDFI